MLIAAFLYSGFRILLAFTTVIDEIFIGSHHDFGTLPGRLVSSSTILYHLENVSHKLNYLKQPPLLISAPSDAPSAPDTSTHTSRRIVLTSKSRTFPTEDGSSKLLPSLIIPWTSTNQEKCYQNGTSSLPTNASATNMCFMNENPAQITFQTDRSCAIYIPPRSQTSSFFLIRKFIFKWQAIGDTLLLGVIAALFITKRLQVYLLSEIANQIECSNIAQVAPIASVRPDSDEELALALRTPLPPVDSLEETSYLLPINYSSSSFARRLRKRKILLRLRAEYALLAAPSLTPKPLMSNVPSGSNPRTLRKRRQRINKKGGQPSVAEMQTSMPAKSTSESQVPELRLESLDSFGNVPSSESNQTPTPHRTRRYLSFHDRMSRACMSNTFPIIPGPPIGPRARPFLHSGERSVTFPTALSPISLRALSSHSQESDITSPAASPPISPRALLSRSQDSAITLLTNCPPINPPVSLAGAEDLVTKAVNRRIALAEANAMAFENKYNIHWPSSYRPRNV
ncbi:hypothetical protein BJ138DRAFT_1123981 [Hygrophoropsis aurantiaca]|uniref:Uncharacterized protein n=1 Tax=Hygrophoropsis aurantiaca TaxID=72124 RepID=A0ACB8AKU7_9AGAM|nr:hypothetical protein BJ138DRAFT_1123981 [Hygrophoropsis aurantiaca]